MIAKVEGWNYFDGNKLSALLRGITSKHDGDLLLELPSFLQNNNQKT